MTHQDTATPAAPTPAPLPERLVGLREKLAYAAGDTASVLYFKVFSSFLVFFYTDIVGIAAGVIATMLIVTRVFDAANDPVMGIIADRTSSRHGKFRPWLRWMVVPYALSGIAVFAVPAWSAPAKITYIYVTYVLAMVFYTAINIPYGALMGVMTPHSNERTALASYRFYGAYIANLIVQATILFLVVELGGSRNGQTATQAGYVWTMVIYSMAAAALFLFTFYFTKERIQPPKGQRSSIKKDLSQLARTKPWLAIIVVGVTTLIWIALRDAAILYYFKYYVVGQIDEGGRFAKLATWFNVIGTVGTLAGVASTNWISGLFGGKKNAYMGLTIIVSFVASLYYFAKPGDIVTIFGIQALISYLMGPLMPLFWAMIADTADFSEWKFGRRFTGLVFSAGTFSQKVGWALGPAFAAYLLDYYGYVENVQQSARTIEGLRLMMSFIPSGIGLGAGLLVMAYGIDERLEAQMEKELAERKSAEGSLAT